MKKPLAILSAVLLSSTTTITTSACKPLTDASQINLQDIIKNPNLGKLNLPNEGGYKPTVRELQDNLKVLFSNLNVNKILIEDITISSATVKGDGNLYTKDSVNVNFSVEALPITKLIVPGFPLGLINTPNPKPTSAELSKAIAERFKNTEFYIEHVVIEDKNITETSALVEGDNVLYTGKVTINFIIDNSIDINTIINKAEKLKVKTNGKDVPDETDLKVALQNKYKKLKLDHLNITNITALNADISAKDEDEVYHGQVQVNLELDTFITLQEIFNKPLPSIAITGEQITLDDIKATLQKQYPALIMNDLVITLSNNNSTVTIASRVGNNHYKGEVTFDNLVVALKSVMDKINLGTIAKPGQDHITVDDIKNALQESNKRLDLTKIILNEADITTEGAKLSGDGTFYSKDSINITYTYDKTILLSNVLQQPSLGEINLNGLNNVTEEQIKAQIVVVNSQVNSAGIIVKNASDTSALIIGDNNTYRGEITVTYTLINRDSIHIDAFKLNHSETNVVGALKSKWASDAIPLLANWTNYAPTWEEFTTKFTKLSFGDNSFFSAYCNTYVDKKLQGDNLTLKTSEINENRLENRFAINYYKEGGIFSAFLQLDGYIHIWHDNENIYLSCDWSIDTANCFRDRVFTIDLHGAIFQ